MGLGTAADVSLADARDAAAAARKLVRQGINPIEQRRVERSENAAAAGLTFAQVANAYIAAHEPSWRNAKHRQQWRNTLDTYADPFLGNLPVAQVEVGEVMRVLEPLWREKTETASRLRGRIESVLDYATARGWRSGENPARWRGHLDNLLPARSKVANVEHHAALPWREIGAFMAALTKEAGVSALALRFAILTAARTSEVIGARWSEIDVEDAVWTVPAARMKAAREHRVPLPDGALDVLREMAKLRANAKMDGFVFPGGKAGKPLSTMALLMLLRRMGRGDLTAHGFRSTFPRLVRGDDPLSARSGGSGVGAHAARQDGGRLSTRRSDGEAPGADGGMGRRIADGREQTAKWWLCAPAHDCLGRNGMPRIGRSR